MLFFTRSFALAIPAAVLTFATGGPTSRAPDPLMGPGVSRELATLRSSLVSAIRYDVSLSVLARDSATGKITVRFDAKRAADVILDFRGPHLSNVTINGAVERVTINGAVERATFNGAHIRLPASDIHAGQNVLTADFTTPIAAAGASIIRFHDDKDGSDYLYTLLVPSDANLLFPCFDQPDLKARLTLTLQVPISWTAIANGITTRVDTSEGAVTYRFRETDPLPTYLFAF